MQLYAQHLLKLDSGILVVALEEVAAVAGVPKIGPGSP